MDWDNHGRAQRIDISDASTNTLLDGRDLSAFTNGTYLVWQLTGHVKIKFTNTLGSHNAVLSGIFFDLPNPPSVNITSPSNADAFTAPVGVTISASATASVGTISKVEFFTASTKLGESTTSPYSFTWSAAPACDYRLTAKATDSRGAVTVSGPVSISVRGLVGHWKFNEGSGGSAADSSGNQLSGTLRGAPVWTNGSRGTALSFGGGSDDAAIGAPNGMTLEEATLAMWVNAPTNSGEWVDWWSLAITGGQWVAEIKSDGNPALYYIGTVPGASHVTDVAGHNLRGAGWKHLAATMSKAGNVVTARQHESRQIRRWS